MFRHAPDKPSARALMIGEGGEIDGQKTEDLSDLAGFLRSGDGRSSMKAALEAWGADSNLFHQGAAKESHDPDVIAAAMAKPGVVLRRPVGTDRPFSEHAELPTDLGGGGPRKAGRKSKAQRQRSVPLAPSTRLRSGRPPSPTSGTKSAASLNGRRKRPPGRRSVNAVSTRSIRRRLRSTGRAGARKESRGDPGRGRGSREEIANRKSPGIRRRSDWKPRYGARGVSFGVTQEPAN